VLERGAALVPSLQPLLFVFINDNVFVHHPAELAPVLPEGLLSNPQVGSLR